MNIVREHSKIIVSERENFDIKSCLECGQIFRYHEISEKTYIVLSGKFMACVKQVADRMEIYTDNTDYFYNFFDLEKSYKKDFLELSNYNNFMAQACEFGKGIRLLKNELHEIVLSFIVSANNNISRIRKTLFRICEQYGEYAIDSQAELWTSGQKFYTFPSVNKLKNADLKFFENVGCGYRAPYLVQTIAEMENKLLGIENMPTEEARKKLLELKGIGPKVADCVLLFGLHRRDVFPVDTWINKVYTDNFGGIETDRKKIAEYFTNTFGSMSGLAQQYVFYYKREEK